MTLTIATFVTETAETSTRKTKVHMKTLMKEKIELKKKFVNATIHFYEESIKTKREKIAVFNDLTNQLKIMNERLNKT